MLYFNVAFLFFVFFSPLSKLDLQLADPHGNGVGGFTFRSYWRYVHKYIYIYIYIYIIHQLIDNHLIQWIIARLPKFSPIWIPCSNWPPKSCLVYILKTELENTSQWFVMLSYNSCPIVVCLVQVIKSLIKISKKIIDIYIYTMWKYFFFKYFQNRQ